jgi:DNA-directed RNA polymerase specialized sigma24 family protein
LLRRFALEETSNEIAFELGMPAATVRVRLHRALAKLRVAMSDGTPPVDRTG